MFSHLSLFFAIGSKHPREKIEQRSNNNNFIIVLTTAPHLECIKMYTNSSIRHRIVAGIPAKRRKSSIYGLLQRSKFIFKRSQIKHLQRSRHILQWCKQQILTSFMWQQCCILSWFLCISLGHCL